MSAVVLLAPVPQSIVPAPGRLVAEEVEAEATAEAVVTGVTFLSHERIRNVYWSMK